MNCYVLSKEEMAKDFDKYFSQGCNIIKVTSLSIIRRIVYALLDKKSPVYVARDADHIMFTLLSEYFISHYITCVNITGTEE